MIKNAIKMMLNPPLLMLPRSLRRHARTDPETCDRTQANLSLSVSEEVLAVQQE